MARVYLPPRPGYHACLVCKHEKQDKFFPDKTEPNICGQCLPKFFKFAFLLLTEDRRVRQLCPICGQLYSISIPHFLHADYRKEKTYSCFRCKPNSKKGKRTSQQSTYSDSDCPNRTVENCRVCPDRPNCLEVLFSSD